MAKIFIATGGSGGHIFPALNVAQTLRDQGQEIIFIGAFGSWRKQIEEKRFALIDLPAKGLAGESFKNTIAAAEYMIKSIAIALRMIDEYQPEAVIGFGGYGAFPSVFAARLKKVVVSIHEQNVVPGRANRLLGKIADKVFVSFEESKRYFPAKKVIISGYPLRLCFDGDSRDKSCRAFGLSPDIFTILIAGGSQGSCALNQVLVQTAELLKQYQDFQILHLSGEKDREIVEMAYRRGNIKHKVLSFLPEMNKAYAIADLCISRAGAGMLHELLYVKIPSIFVPYPYAGGHQRQNALAYLKSGEGTILEEKYLTAERLASEISVFMNRQQDRNNFQHHSIIDSDAARIIADYILE